MKHLLLIAFAAVAAFGQTNTTAICWAGEGSARRMVTCGDRNSSGIVLSNVLKDIPTGWEVAPATPTQLIPAQKEHDSIEVVVEGKRYRIDAKYDTGYSFVPAVAGSQQYSHYRAEFTIGQKVGRNVWLEIAKLDGEYTGWRCFEDKPETLVRRALEKSKESK